MFKGIRETSFVDYPGKISTVLFTAGCNFRCDWCHNRSLVLPELIDLLPDISEDSLRATISERRDFIQAVCITGGEPTLWGDALSGMMRWIRSLSLLVKIDTNGALPDVLVRWYDEGLVDFTAMDIKNSAQKYSRTAGLQELDLEPVERSIRLIRERSPGFQFRITRVPGLVEDADIAWIENRYGVRLTVQEFRPVPSEGRTFAIS